MDQKPHPGHRQNQQGWSGRSFPEKMRTSSEHSSNESESSLGRQSRYLLQ